MTEKFQAMCRQGYEERRYATKSYRSLKRAEEGRKRLLAWVGEREKAKKPRKKNK